MSDDDDLLQDDAASAESPDGERKRHGSGAASGVLFDANDSRMRRVFRWISRVLLLVAVATALMWQGGVSLPALITCFVLVALAWLFAIPALPHKPPRIRFAWIWLGLGIWSLVQAAPLPRGLVRLLHPRAVEMADASRKALNLPVLDWLPMTLAPSDGAIQAALMLLAGLTGILLATVFMGSNGRFLVDRARAMLVVLISVSQWFWLCVHQPELADYVPQSLRNLLVHFTFINPNSQSGLVNIAIALSLGRVIHASTVRWQTVYVTVCLALSLCVMLIPSRGGILTLGFMLAMTVFTLPRPPETRRIDPREKLVKAQRRLLALAVSVALLGAIVALPAMDQEFGGTDANKMAKFVAFRKTAGLLVANPLFGVGAGSLPVIAGTDPLFSTARVDFAENMAMQRILDSGWPLGLLFIGAVLWQLWQVVQRWNRVEAAPALLVSTCTLLLANLADFSMELAGGLLPFIVVATSLDRVLPPSAESRKKPWRLRRNHKILMAVAGVVVAGTGWMLARASVALSRNDNANLTDLPMAQAREITAKWYLHDHHAFYILGRKALEAHDKKQALALFDRAVVLRPDSKHAHLFRFATRLEVQDTRGAKEDLAWLIHFDPEMMRRAINLCTRAGIGADVLAAVVPELAEYSYQIGIELLVAKRPDLVEKVAMDLRKRFPSRHFGIDAARGSLYVKRGLLKPARKIAGDLMSDPATRLEGYMLEGELRAAAGRPYEAFHMFRQVCDTTPGNADACYGAMNAILQANRPSDALEFIQTQRKQMFENTNTAGYYWMQIARAKYQMGRVDEALDAARTAQGLVAEGNQLEATLILANCLVHLDLFDEAHDVLERVHVKHADDPTVMRLWKQVENRGSAAERLRDNLAIDGLKAESPTGL